MKRLLIIIACSVSLAPSPVFGFDYLEHSYFSDRACEHAQEILRAELLSSEYSAPVLPRYLALGLLCPIRSPDRYCKGGYKQAHSALSKLKAPPSESFDHSLTLGDIAALPDHLSTFGAVKTLEGASQDGLVSEVIRLLEPDADEPKSVIRDVAEDACETNDKVPWSAISHDIEVGASRIHRPVGSDQVAPGSWVAPPRGPFDPAGKYSFDNPHYLDLVLNNHHHFGDEAYASWTGYHATALALARKPCEGLLSLRDGQLEDLADDLPRFESIDWDELPETKRSELACDLVATRVGERVNYWLQKASPALTQPIGAITRGPIANDDTLMRATLSALVGLVYESAGLHYLQDNLAGGHLRVDRAAHGLGVSRHLHDTDGRQGVLADLTFSYESFPAVLFGDSYLLGPTDTARTRHCDTHLSQDPADQTACHLQKQRALITHQSAASLVHWALGGPSLQDLRCRDRAYDEPLCSLSVEPARPSGSIETPMGTLPLAPPRFAFQSLATSLSMDATGRATQTGLRLVFLSALGQEAGWMTSYHFGFLQTTRPYNDTFNGNEFLTEFSYMFHWRWAARFLVNAGVYTYSGFQGLGQDLSFLWGLGPNVGLTLLPEGWTKIPLEFTFSYRFPLTLLNSRYGWSSEGIRGEAHWLELSIGLAFM